MRLTTLIILLLAGQFAFGQPPVGIQMGSVGKKFREDIPGTLKALKEWGVKELEGGAPRTIALDDYLKMLKDNGLSIVAIGSQFDDLAKNPLQYVYQAKALGAKQVICYWIPHKGDTLTLEDAQKAVTVFNQAGELFAKNGLAFGYHAHGYEFLPYEQSTLFDYLAKNLDPKFANFQMDVFWIKQSGTDPVELLKKYPNRFISLHLKDRLKGMPDSKNGRADVEKANVVLGTGDVNIEAIMKAAYKAGIKHYFIEDESSRSIEQVPQSIAFLKTIKY